MAAEAKAERSKLTPAQSKKVEMVVGNLASRLKVKKDDLANLQRYADKYLRFKLGVRGTGPHSHGFNAEQRKLITGTLNAEFNIKAPVKVKAAPKKATAKSRGGKGKSRSTAQLAKEQTARAGQPIAGTVVLRQGS